MRTDKHGYGVVHGRTFTAGRCWVLLVALAATGEADVEELIRRADVRIAHGNVDGAILLLEEALREDPSSAAAMDRMARHCREMSLEFLFRYLRDARPLNRERVDGLIPFLGPFDMPDEAWRRVERDALLPADAWEEAAGPFLPPAIPDRLPPWLPAVGPLRSEVFGSPTHRHRERLAEIAARWEADGVVDPCLWATLARMCEQIGDEEARKRGLARARAESLEDRMACATIPQLESVEPESRWLEVFEPILDELEKGQVRQDGTWLWYWFFASCTTAATRLGEDSAILRVAKLDARTARPGPDAARRLRSAIAKGWEGTSMYEVYEALRDDQDPVAGCMRAILLDEMLQYDRALGELDQVMSRHPDAWLPHAVLLTLAGEPAGAVQRRSAQFLLRAALAAWDAGIAPDTRDLLRVAGWTGDPGDEIEVSRRLLQGEPPPERVLDMLRHWDYQRGAPVELLAEAVMRLPRWVDIDRVDEPRDPREVLARIAFRERRADIVLAILDGLVPRRAATVGEELRVKFGGAADFAQLLELLRRFASDATPSWTCDAVVRAFLRNGAQDVPFDFCRAREKLSEDRAFLALPGAWYVVSLLFDPAFQREEAVAARKAAYAAGCRAPGLLLEMAEEGEDVVHDLGRVDRPAARLFRALRSEGTEALLAFFDEDEATAEQVVRAEDELLRRGGRPPSPTPRIAPSWRLVNALHHRVKEWAPAGEVARAILEYAESPNRACLLRWRSLAPFLSPGLEESLEEAWPRPIPHPTPTVANRIKWVSQGFSNDEAGFRELSEVLRAGGEEALGQILRGPRGVEVARDYRYGPLQADLGLGLVSAARQIAAERPLDLRWIQVEPQLPSGATPSRSDAEVRGVLNAAALRTPDAVASEINRAADDEARKNAIDRFLELTREDTPREVLRSIDGVCENARLTTSVVERLMENSHLEGDEAALSAYAQRWGHPEVSAALDRELVQSADPHLRCRAMARCIRRDPAGFDAEGLLATPVPQGRTDQELLTLWKHIGQGAVERKDAVALWKCFEGMWDDATLCFIYDPWFREQVRGWVAEKVAPTWAWYLARSVVTDAGAAPIEPPPGDELARRGVYLRYWLATEKELPAGATARSVEQVLGSCPSGRPAYETHYLVREFVRRLIRNGRRDEAIACADLWADRNGAVAPPEGVQEWNWVGILDPNARRPQPDLRDYPGGEWPRGIHAAFLLADVGLPDVAAERMDAAIAEAAPDFAESLLLRSARLRIDAKRPSEAVPLLSRLARGSLSSVVRRSACRELVALASVPQARPALMQDLIERLEGLPDAPPERVEAWERRLGAEDSSVRQAASDELEAMGGTALPLLLALRRSPDLEVRARAEALLSDLATWK